MGGICRSSSFVNCGLVAFPKRVCSDVQDSVIKISSLLSARFLRLERVNFGDAATTVAISRS